MLKKLIEEGESLKEYIQEGMVVNFLEGEEYSLWIAKCLRFLELHYSDSDLTIRFKELSKNAIGEDVKIYYQLLGIVKAIEEVE